MIYDFIAVGIIVVGIGLIFFIVSRKFPTIAAINTNVLEKHKQGKVKKFLIEDRLKRKLTALKLRSMFTKGNENG